MIRAIRAVEIIYLKLAIMSILMFLINAYRNLFGDACGGCYRRVDPLAFVIRVS